MLHNRNVMESGVSRLVNHNITIAPNRRTSMRLEPEFWAALHQIAAERGVSRDTVIAGMVANAAPGERTSTVRVAVLAWAMWRADDWRAAFTNAYLLREARQQAAVRVTYDTPDPPYEAVGT